VLIATALSEFAGNLKYEAVPPAVARRAKLLLLDAIGVAFAATQYEFAKKGLAGIRRFGEGDAIVIGSECTLNLRDAVLMNGMLVHGLDYDDTYLPGSVHLTSSTVPCALGMAAATGASGRELLMGCIVGLETGARIGLGGKGGFQQAGFHPTSTCGSLSSALIAGRLYGLDVQQQTRALGIALSFASGSMQPIQDGTWTKRIHPGWAAGAGITAASMAGAGFIGPEAVFEGHFGFYTMFLGKQAANAEPALITGGLGREWEFTRSSIKLFPACHQSHAFINAAIKIASDPSVRAEDIESVKTLVAQASVPLICEPQEAKRHPDSSYLAQFSLPYAMATSLTRKRFGLNELEESSYTDPGLVRLAEKVSYEIDPNSGYPKFRSGEVVVKMRDGRELRQREEILPDEPASEESIVAKFMNNVSMIIGQPRADELCAMILSIEDEPDSRRLASALGK
jgi:2-methylcitrate dehydratase PrpD